MANQQEVILIEVTMWNGWKSLYHSTAHTFISTNHSL